MNTYSVIISLTLIDKKRKIENFDDKENFIPNNNTKYNRKCK